MTRFIRGKSKNKSISLQAMSIIESGSYFFPRFLVIIPLKENVFIPKIFQKQFFFLGWHEMSYYVFLCKIGPKFEWEQMIIFVLICIEKQDRKFSWCNWKEKCFQRSLRRMNEQQQQKILTLLIMKFRLDFRKVFLLSINCVVGCVMLFSFGGRQLAI